MRYKLMYYIHKQIQIKFDCVLFLENMRVTNFLMIFSKNI